MKIGLDAKRAYCNRTGLGNYSRTIIDNLLEFYPSHEYRLYTPKTDFDYSPEIKNENIKKIIPSGLLKGSLWRTFGITDEIIKSKLDIYHGLSHELPRGINKFPGKKIVTIHDLIYLRYPHMFKFFDRKTYDSKFRHACKEADHIIAISEQSAKDICHYFGTAENKIQIIYQGCHPRFYQRLSPTQKNITMTKYNVNRPYILSVGTIEERKNTLNIIKAYQKVASDFDLVIIGRGGKYQRKIERYLVEENLMDQVKILSGVNLEELIAFYQDTLAFIYPSIFEGFGLPVLEGIASGAQVITSDISSMPEAGGKAAHYVDPTSVSHIADCMKDVVIGKRKITNEVMLEHLEGFTAKKLSGDLMQIYTC